MRDYRVGIGDGKCSHDSCPYMFRKNEWGCKEAQSLGWFMQRNGQAWCPEHNPDWVAEWRARKSKEKNVPSEAHRDDTAEAPGAGGAGDLDGPDCE